MIKINCPKCNSEVEVPTPKFPSGVKFGVKCPNCGMSIAPKLVEKLKKNK